MYCYGKIKPPFSYTIFVVQFFFINSITKVTLDQKHFTRATWMSQKVRINGLFHLLLGFGCRACFTFIVGFLKAGGFKGGVTGEP